ASDIVRELMKHTDGARDAMPLRGLLSLLNESPETLVVLNHPLWDIEFIGAERHRTCLTAFLAEHGEWIHAFEINGFRRWAENKAVMKLAEGCGFAVVRAVTVTVAKPTRCST